MGLAMGCLALWTTLAVAAGSNPRDSALRVTYEAPLPVVDAAGMGAWLMRLGGRYQVDGMVEVVFDHDDFHAHRCGFVNPDGTVVEPFCKNVTGKADCVNIGKGPGVQCILQISWQEMFFIVSGFPEPNPNPGPEPSPPPAPPGVYTLPGGNSFLRPAMLMIGMDPHQAGLKFLLVNDKGLPEGGAGTIKGDRATLPMPCVNGPVVLNSMRQDLINHRLPGSCESILYIDAKQDSSFVNLAFDIRINDETYTVINITLRRQTPH
jgi:hypothetical protein